MNETPAERYRRVSAIFADARGLRGADLDGFLVERCGDDQTLRAEVEGWLASAANSDDVFADEQIERTRKALESTLGDSTSSPIPDTIGPYEIVRQLGRGGMGIVYEATQRSPRRRVAIKLLPAMGQTEERLRRFRLEAEVLGRLHHPGIAQIFEAATCDIGHGPQPYFVMELVDGVPLTDYADAHDLSKKQRLGLVAQLCDVVQHAHQQGIVHRDLKPANILVTIAETTTTGSSTDAPLARLKVLDFGVARMTDDADGTITMQTLEGQLVGTLQYMSPEQASGDSRAVDSRSDVYSLGVLAYELLVGHPPHDVHGKLLHEAVRTIREDDPTGLGTEDRSLRGDVETMVGKALEKDKERRYATAAEFGADIRRYLADLPIESRPPSALYQLRKFARRNKALVGGALATLVVAVVGAVVALSFAIEATNRAARLSNLVDYHSAIVGDIDVQRMGARSREAMADALRQELRRSGATDIEQRVAEFESLVADVDFTELSLRVLEDNVFARSMQAAEARFADEPELQAELLHDLAQTLSRVGLVDRAVTAEQRAVALRRQVLGNENLDTTESVTFLAMLHRYRGEYDLAREMLGEALASYRKLVPWDDPRLVGCIEWMGWLLHSAGLDEEAEPFRAELHATKVRLLGADHQQTRHALADWRYSQGRFAESEALFRGLLTDCLAADPDKQLAGTLIQMTNLAEVLPHVGKTGEAEALLHDAIPGFGRIWGRSNKRTLEITSRLAELERQQGKLQEAERTLRDTLERQQRTLRPEHPDTLATRRALDEVLAEIRRAR